MELIEATLEGGEPATVDPSACFDVDSGAILMNCYDTLVLFDGEHADKYMPQLAAEWSIVQNNPPIHDPDTGLDWYWTYYFRIRQGVPWQDPTFGNVTPADVEYTFERGMVLDPADGPQWMFYEPLLNGMTHTFVNQQNWDPAANTTQRDLLGFMIDHAVQSNSTHAWFNLAFNGTYPPLMRVLCQQWSSIICKAWVNSLGRSTDWPGNWPDHTSWFEYCNPATPPLDNPTPEVMGSGPFKLAHLDMTLKYWDAYRFTGYWRNWGNGPAPNYGIGWPAFGGSKPAGYIDHFVITWAYDWNTRSTMFLKGEVDFCAVPRQYIGQMLNQPNIRCTYPLLTLLMDALLYNFNVDLASSFGPIFDYGALGENGIPRDFFSDINVRKAFSHLIDYDTFMATVYAGEAIQPATAVVQGLPYYDSTIPKYNYDRANATLHFQAAWGGRLWNTGFNITLCYSSARAQEGLTLYGMLKNSIESINPRFHVAVTEALSPVFNQARNHAQLTMFTMGWLDDYPDPHNYVNAFYYTEGPFARQASYSDPQMDALIEAGIHASDGPTRGQIYRDIQLRVIETCPSVALDERVSRHFEQSWICGWYMNPVYPHNYPANLWKWYYSPQAQQDTVMNDTANLLPYDVNYDGRTNMIDIASAAASFGAAYGPPIGAKWNFRCDFNNDRRIDMKDIAGVAKNFGKTSSVWTPSF